MAVERLYLTRREACVLLGIGSTHFSQLRKSEGFPKVHYFGERCLRWKKEELEKWAEAHGKEETA